MMRYSIKTMAVVSFLAVQLSGCGGNNAYTRSDIAKAAKTELIGMTKENLLSCAGVPNGSYVSNGTEFLSYRSGGSTSHSAYTTPGIGGYAPRTYISSRNRYCDINITLKNNIVRKVNYSGKTGAALSRDSECAYVLERCVR
jgi:hypothetical protein